MKIKVGIVGTGTIGHRVVAYAGRQKDMEVVGVSKVTAEDSYGITKEIWRAGIPIYSASRGGKSGLKESVSAFKSYFDKIKDKERLDLKKDLVPGSIEDLLDVCDVIVDCSDGEINGKSISEFNKENFYVPHNLKANKKLKVIFQGGEDANIGKISFNTSVNYDEAVEVGNSEEPYIRQVSCNTTALSRLLYVVLMNYTMNRMYVVIVRRSTDPGEEKRNILNSVHMGDSLPSHHGPDVMEVFKNFKNFDHMLDKQIITSAIKVTTDQMHAHDVTMTFPVGKPFSKDNYPTKEDFINICKNSVIKNRIILLERPIDTSTEREIARRAERMGSMKSREIRCGNCGDIFQLLASLKSYAIIQRKTVYGNEWVHVKLHLGVHQESIVMPDTIDAIRALSYGKLGVSMEESIKMTDESLGMDVNY